MPPRHPFFIGKKSGHLSKHYIFIASCTMHFSWSVRCFCYQFSFVLFPAINGWITSCWFGGRHTSFFIAKNTLVFTLHFCLDFCSDLVISLHQGVFVPLVYVCFHQKSCLKRFEWCWKREKALCKKKVVQKGACVDCGLGFCMSCLMSF
jgi:hypothetical protein